jgi:hypothetical protein
MNAAPVHLFGSRPATSRAERRSEVRFDARQASVTATVNGVSAELIEVSKSGLSVRVPVLAAGGQSRAEVCVELRQNDVAIATVALRVLRSRHEGDAAVLGGRIERSEVISSGRSPLPRSGDVIEIRDPALRADVIEKLLSQVGPSIARLESGTSVEAVLKAGSKDPKVLALRSEALDASLLGQFVSVEVALFDCRFVLEATLVERRGDEWLLSPLLRVLSLSRRLCERVSVPVNGGSLAWGDVLDPERTVQVRVLDISPVGMAVELPSGELLPPPPVPATLCLGANRFRVLVEAHRSERTADGATIVGLRLHPLRPADLIRIGRLCESIRFPNLVRRRTVPPGAVLDLMQKSGYLALRDGTGPDRAWHDSTGDESLAVDSVFRSDGGTALGHFSCARIYPKTWILHQLATVGLRRDRVAYPLYLQLMDWIATLAGNEGYALAYFNQERSWHQVLFASFVRWVGSESLSMIADLDRFEPRSESIPPAVEVAGLSVREARPEDLPFAAGLARAKLPALVCDALHLHESSIATQNLCQEHTAAGLSRTRTTFVVEAQRELLGVAICETGAGHLSLFNILNMAHVFFREPVAPATARAAQALLFGRVQAFYRERGGVQPLIVAPAGNARFASGAGLERAETMGVWAASLEGIKQWRNYLHFCLGSLARRKRSRTTEPSDHSGSEAEGKDIIHE